MNAICALHVGFCSYVEVDVLYHKRAMDLRGAGGMVCCP